MELKWHKSQRRGDGVVRKRGGIKRETEAEWLIEERWEGERSVQAGQSHHGVHLMTTALVTFLGLLPFGNVQRHKFYLNLYSSSD